MRLLGFPDAEDVDWFREETVGLVGVSMEGPGNLSAAQDLLHEVLLRWQDLRDARDYGGADEIRSALEAMGVSVRATGDGPQASMDQDSRLDRDKLEALKK